MKNKTSKKYNINNKYGKDKYLNIILISSISIATFFFIVAFFHFSGNQIITIEFLQPLDYIIFGILTILGPYGFYNSIIQKRNQDIMNKLPEFLRDIANSSASGMTIYDSIRNASEGNYGELTNELKMMVSQLSWGIPIDEVLTNFAKRLKNNEVKRLALTINKALEIGGNTSSVFNAAAKEINQIKRIEQQRRTEMSMYSIVIFVSLFVFIAVIIIINGTIFQAIYDLQDQMAGRAIGDLRIGDINPDEVKTMFYTFVSVQSLGGGLLTGFMMDARLNSGIRYSFILLIITFFTFKIFI